VCVVCISKQVSCCACLRCPFVRKDGRVVRAPRGSLPGIHVHLDVPCRPGTGTPEHGTVPPCPGTARRDLVPCRASTPCRLSCPGTARLSLDGPCRAWGTVSPAVPCRARAQDTQELNQLQIMQYKQISYVQTQAFNNS